MSAQPSKRPAPNAAPRGPAPMRAADNPFINAEENILPFIADTEEWHYCWIRYRIGQETDSKNVVRHLQGKLPYEIVTLDMLGDDSKSFRHLKIGQGEHMGAIGISDVILARTPMHLYRLYMQATQIRADNMSAALRDEVNSKNSDRRGRVFVEEDSEADGVMPGRAEFVQ